MREGNTILKLRTEHLAVWAGGNSYPQQHLKTIYGEYSSFNRTNCILDLVNRTANNLTSQVTIPKGHNTQS